jgi:hypothetical protein
VIHQVVVADKIEIEKCEVVIVVRTISLLRDGVEAG